ncbi:MAG: membrane protease subunit HflC [Candidatus Promineifilaceae bacterium]|jgi:modulator of FtsH protease HflC
MKSFVSAFYGFIIFAVVVIVANSLYVVQETEQVILTQFGRPVGDAVSAAGLHFRVPFIQKPNSIEKRIMAWDGRPNDMPTKDKLYITVDTFARWRISDPLQYFLRLRDERSALSRLDDILGSETRNAVAKHELIEIIRTSKDRVPVDEGVLGEAGTSEVQWLPIQKGRVEIEKEIFGKAEGKLVDFGIELLDVRFKRINYNPNVREKIYDRMISERMQIASRFRSEGEGEAEIILGNKERDLREIESEAYKEIQEIMGQADAKATEVYASAYNQSPEAIELYTFVKTLETYERGLDANTTLILTTDSDLFRYLKTAE